MAGSRTGTPTIVKAARRICRVVGKLGASDLGTRTTPAFQAAVLALVAACQVLEATDDHILQIDRTAPYGPGDIQQL